MECPNYTFPTPFCFDFLFFSRLSQIFVGFRPPIRPSETRNSFLCHYDYYDHERLVGGGVRVCMGTLYPFLQILTMRRVKK